MVTISADLEPVIYKKMQEACRKYSLSYDRFLNEAALDRIEKIDVPLSKEEIRNLEMWKAFDETYLGQDYFDKFEALKDRSMDLIHKLHKQFKLGARRSDLQETIAFWVNQERENLASLNKALKDHREAREMFTARLESMIDWLKKQVKEFLRCPDCDSQDVVRNGTDKGERDRGQKWKCNSCHHMWFTKELKQSELTVSN